MRTLVHPRRRLSWPSLLEGFREDAAGGMLMRLRSGRWCLQCSEPEVYKDHPGSDMWRLSRGPWSRQSMEAFRRISSFLESGTHAPCIWVLHAEHSLDFSGDPGMVLVRSYLV